MKKLNSHFLAVGMVFLSVLSFTHCSATTASSSAADDGSDSGSGSSCTLIEDTSSSGETNGGCDLLVRDTDDCEEDRLAEGLSGFWLNFSCRVTLSLVSSGGDQYVQALADGLPDYRSNYFDSSDPCYDADAAGDITNPNEIEEFEYTFLIPQEPTVSVQDMSGGIVGLAVNGVPIFDNQAAPGDDIYEEAETFDVCQAHPTNTGTYHYHSEPYAITHDDDNFVGVMRDGFPVYGRKDADGSYPTLDAAGGHTGTTPDSPSTAVYHYHVNEQTSTNEGTLGETQWFITTGTYHGEPGSLTTQ